jgi:hypothetical protein
MLHRYSRDSPCSSTARGAVHRSRAESPAGAELAIRWDGIGGGEVEDNACHLDHFPTPGPLWRKRFASRREISGDQ